MSGSCSVTEMVGGVVRGRARSVILGRTDISVRLAKQIKTVHRVRHKRKSNFLVWKEGT